AKSAPLHSRLGDKSKTPSQKIKKSVVFCTQVENSQPLLQLIIITVHLSLSGHVPTGLKCHPDQEHLIFPLGCTILIQAINTQEQNFLQGHGNNVSCLAISRSGRYIASGQVTFMGFKCGGVEHSQERCHLRQPCSRPQCWECHQCNLLQVPR
uniref:Cilia and flagella associated protein 52 n=1 Tax=Macaca fascicularis TaxID=9541 RepID=A0A7N9D9I7_MACFA